MSESTSILQNRKQHTERMVPGTRKWASGYAEHIARYMFIGNIQGKRVLDIGCGVGYGADYLVKQGALEVVGVDYSDEALDYAKEHYIAPNLTFIKDDAQKLEHVSGKFDVISAFEVFEHISDHEAMLARVKELLRNDGCFFCSTPNSLLQPKLDDGKTPRNPFHLKEFTLPEYEAIMGKYFSNAETYGQRLDPNFLRIKNALHQIRKQAVERDFKMWTNPLMKLGRVIQSILGKNVTFSDEFKMPPETNDVIISRNDIDESRYFISKCMKQT